MPLAHTVNAVTCRAGSVRNQRLRLTDKAIEQSGLANIRATYNGYEGLAAVRIILARGIIWA